MADAIFKDLKSRLDKALDNLKRELAGLRTGRASTALLEPIIVEAYGSKMPLPQVGTIGAPEPRILSVQVWDTSLAKAVEKAIRESGLGLNPITEGQLIRVPLPELSEDRRKELVKVARKYGEDTRVSMRNIRRDCMDQFKALQKNSEISEDEFHRHSEQVQKALDEVIKKVDSLITSKEDDIMKV